MKRLFVLFIFLVPLMGFSQGGNNRTMLDTVCFVNGTTVERFQIDFEMNSVSFIDKFQVHEVFLSPDLPIILSEKKNILKSSANLFPEKPYHEFEIIRKFPLKAKVVKKEYVLRYDIAEEKYVQEINVVADKEVNFIIFQLFVLFILIFLLSAAYNVIKNYGWEEIFEPGVAALLMIFTMGLVFTFFIPLCLLTAFTFGIMCLFSFIAYFLGGFILYWIIKLIETLINNFRS